MSGYTVIFAVPLNGKKEDLISGEYPLTSKQLSQAVEEVKNLELARSYRMCQILASDGKVEKNLPLN